jgi:glucosamine--fructose-6-phosphate aminotransferase (isomerizing)
MRFETAELTWDNMRKGIDGQVDLLATAPLRLYEQATRAITGPAPARMYFVGCGDSHFCGLAARYATELWTGIATEALESLEFSRYAVRTAPADALVVAVSNSGEVARSVEALKYARQAGMRAVGITYKPDSRLAANADEIIAYDYRDVGFGPGTMSYVASVLSLLAVALRVGRLTGRLDDVGVLSALDSIMALAPVLRDTIAASNEPACRLAEQIADQTQVFVLGAGPNYGTALFAMAKMIESARHNTVAQQLEEWAHEQYFCCGPGTTTIVIAPPGASLDRAREQLQAVRDMKGTAVAICAADDEQTRALADVVIPVVGTVDEPLSPLVYLAASELLAMHVGMHTQKVMLGFDDDWRRKVNLRQIFGSAIPDSLDAADSGR